MPEDHETFLHGFGRVPPITEGYVRKGGLVTISEITGRPPGPAPIRPAPAALPAAPAAAATNADRHAAK